MKRLVFRKPLLLSIVVVTAACGVARCAEPIRWSLNEGDKLRAVSTQKSLQKLDTGDGKIEAPTLISITTNWTVAEANDEAFKVNQLIKRMQVEIKSAAITIVFDSDKPADEDDPIGKIFRPLVGVTISQTLTSRGEIKEVSIPDGVMEKVTANPIAAKFLSKGALKNLFAQGNVQLPEGAIDIGETWTSESRVGSLVGSVNGKHEYTYAGPETKDGKLLERINVRTRFDIDAIKSPIGGKMKVSQATGSSVILFDAKAGRLHSITSDQSITSKLSFFGKRISQEMTATTTTTLTPIDSRQR